MGSKIRDDAMVLLPRHVVSDEQWAAVPRTVPNRLLRWGSILPYYALIAWWIIADEPTEFVVALIFWGFFTVFSARMTPWLALSGVCGLYLSADLDPLTTGLLVAGAAWFLGLGLGATLSGLRLSLAIRRWRLLAAGSVTVSRSLLAGPGTLITSRGRVEYFLVMIIALILFRFGAMFVRDRESTFRSLAETFTFADGGLVIPLLAILFWLGVSLVAWIVERIAGDVVLQVPVDPTHGPLRLARVLKAVPRTEALRPGCTCGAKQSDTGGDMPQVLVLDDVCPIHGIDAVNALEPQEFLRVAHEPWVWGENAAALPVRANERLEIVGLYGWGSRPAVVSTPAPGKNAEAPTHTGYRPWRTAEVFHRANRKIRWRDLADSDPNFLAEKRADAPITDHIRLHGVGLPGYAVRSTGQRPRFETNPAPLVRTGVLAHGPSGASTPSR